MQHIERLLRENPEPVHTPCYLYSVSKVEQNYNALKDALGTDLIFSLKSNANVDLLIRATHFLTDGIEVASIGELNLVAGGSTQKFVNNPSADKTFLRAGIASKAVMIIDNLDQLDLIAELTGKRPLKGVLLRLNSSVLRHFDETHPKVRPDQFGMDWQTALTAVQRCKEKGLPLQGFHLFKGSYSFEKTATATVDAVKGIIAEIEASLGDKLSFVNLGGGFGENWQKTDFDYAAYREKLKELPDYIRIAHESGRGIMASAGHFVTRVRYMKTIEDGHFAICDGGVAQNFLLAQTENRFAKLKAPHIVQKTDSAQIGACTFVGSSCSKDDVIGKQDSAAVLPSPGDFCVFDNCGAYNASYTVSPFLKLPEPKFYIID